MIKKYLKDAKAILKLTLDDIVEEWLYMPRKQKLGVIIILIIGFIMFYIMKSLNIGFMGLF